ncbi:RidA family protein [Sphingomonas sp. NPDC092331]|jgi:enamine deaminase RidA (YjgF/YER057c/UK114 family)|uniref:RidA family protein n=1 Tax=unclassified Sphingomonas TaxID=196159 RepID=UPI0031F4D9F9
MARDMDRSIGGAANRRRARRAMALAAAALACLPAAAHAQRSAMTVIMPENPGAKASQEDWGYAEAVVAGNTIYLSGVVVGFAPGETDLEAAFDRAFRRIEATLKRAGASWDDVVDITSFHTDILPQLAAMKRVKHRYVHAPFPAWTAIDVDRLLPDAGLTEIKVVAVKR